MSELRVGFVGLGAMGQQMAGHLHRAGVLVAVSNRSAAKAQAFAAEHGVTAATPAELASTCNVVVLCVSADADVLGEALGLDPAVLLPTLASGAAGCWFLDKRGATMLRNEFAGGFKAALLHKDLGIVRKIAQQVGTDHSIVDKSLTDLAELMAQGRGDEEHSAVIRLKRRKA